MKNRDSSGTATLYIVGTSVVAPSNVRHQPRRTQSDGADGCMLRWTGVLSIITGWSQIAARIRT